MARVILIEPPFKINDVFNEHTFSDACETVRYVILHSDAQLFKQDQRAKTFITGGG